MTIERHFITICGLWLLLAQDIFSSNVLDSVIGSPSEIIATAKLSIHGFNDRSRLRLDVHKHSAKLLPSFAALRSPRPPCVIFKWHERGEIPLQERWPWM